MRRAARWESKYLGFATVLVSLQAKAVSNMPGPGMGIPQQRPFLMPQCAIPMNQLWGVNTAFVPQIQAPLTSDAFQPQRVPAIPLPTTSVVQENQSYWKLPSFEIRGTDDTLVGTLEAASTSSSYRNRVNIKNAQGEFMGYSITHVIKPIIDVFDDNNQLLGSIEAVAKDSYAIKNAAGVSTHVGTWHRPEDFWGFLKSPNSFDIKDMQGRTLVDMRKINNSYNSAWSISKVDPSANQLDERIFLTITAQRALAIEHEENRSPIWQTDPTKGKYGI